MDERTVITIGREFGSGGHEIGQKLADFKDKLFEQAAKHPQLFLAVGAVMLLFLSLQQRKVVFVRNFLHHRMKSQQTAFYIH